MLVTYRSGAIAALLRLATLLRSPARRLPMLATAAAAAALALVLLVPAVARADGPYDGAWTMTAVSESFTVQEWSAPCGPAPVSGTLMGGGPVTVTGGGGELQISGGRRALRTDLCLDPMPTLGRTVHTQDARSWRTRCATPPGDPRHAVINTAYFVSGDNTITIAETGRYEFTINEARCVADVRRGATLSRFTPAPAATDVPPAVATTTASAAPPATTTAPFPTATAPPLPTAPAVPRVDCSTPGDPARLEVRPSRKLLRLGDTFAFRGVVLDANGCPTTTAIGWTLGAVTFKDGQPHAGVPAIDASGKVSVPSADFGEATFDVVATAAGRSARASVQVATPTDYGALLAQSGLDSNGEREEPAVAVLATSSIGAADAKAEDGARKRRIAFIAVVSALALLLLVVAIVGATRGRRVRKAQAAAEARHVEKMREWEKHKAEREARHAAQMRAHLQSVAVAQQQAAAAKARGVDTGPMFCPSCRREFPPGTAYCSFDSNQLVAVRGHEALMSGPAGGICPTCKRGFNPGVKVCPHDGDELVPAPMATASTTAIVAAPVAGAPMAGAPPRGKICPTCGGRFEGASAFCVNDGTQLVLIN